MFLDLLLNYLKDKVVMPRCKNTQSQEKVMHSKSYSSTEVSVSKVLKYYIAGLFLLMHYSANSILMLSDNTSVIIHVYDI